MNAHADMAKKEEPESVKYTTPQQIPGITTAVAVHTRGTTFVRLKDGTLLGWGSGIFGALGNGHIEGTFPRPTPPIGLGPVLDLFLTNSTTFALKADGIMWTWGGDRREELTPRPWRKMKLPD
jgi:alpha-tubulin suppressor-like RCC1 family protein